MVIKNYSLEIVPITVSMTILIHSYSEYISIILKLLFIELKK